MNRQLIRITNSQMVWELREIARRLGNKNILHPCDNAVEEAKKDCEDILPGDGRVNHEFANWVLMAYEYAQEVSHNKTHNTLLNDVIVGEKISFSNYE